MLNFYQKGLVQYNSTNDNIIYVMHMSISYCTNQKLPRCRKRCKGNTLPGVTILETGTSNGVSTNIDGIFEIKLRPGSTLTVSYIGYITRTIPTNDKTTF